MKLRWVVLVAILAMGVMAGTVNAAGIPESKRVATIEMSQSAPVLTKLSSTSSGTDYCFTRAVKAKGQNLLKQTVWYLKQRLNWCSKLITKNNCNCWKVVANPYPPTKPCAGTTYKITNWGAGWDWKGFVDCKYGGGVGFSNVYRWREGHFQYCAVKVGCVQNVFPFAWIKGNGNGLGTYTSGVGKK